MHPPARRIRRARLAASLRLVGAAVALTWAATAALAASPAPSIAPATEPTEEPVEEFELEAWLDGPLPLDASAGATLHVGAFVWIRGPEEVVRGATLKAFLHPATGTAEPAFDYAHQEFPGHFVADLVVPMGGVGTLELFLPGTICENDVCGPRETPIRMAGVGPPAGVRLSALANAFTSAPIEALVVGRPLEFEISVQAKIDWPAPGLDLPAQLWLQVREPQGPLLDDAVATLEDAATGRYVASLTFDEPGDYVLEAGSRPDAEGTDLLPRSIRRVTVEAAAATPVPAAAGAGEGLPAYVPLVAAGVAVVVVLVALAGKRAGTRRRV